MRALKLIGNGTYDWIVGPDVNVNRMGGIYTIRDHLRIPHCMFPTETSVVVVNLAPRYSNWITVHRRIDTTFLPKTYWTHISYLDMLDIDIRSVRETSEFISVDLCKTYYTEEELATLSFRLEAANMIFLSIEDWKRTKDIIPGSCIKVIREHDKIHWDTGLYSDYSCVNSEYIEVANPVGAGDVFVAGCLNFLCRDDPPDRREIMRQGNHEAIKFLREQNEV